MMRPSLARPMFLLFTDKRIFLVMRKSIQLAILVLASVSSFAQDDVRHKAYMEQLAKDRKAYNDAYIDALRYNRNTPSAKQSGSSDESQKLADIFAARAGRETPAQKAERERQNEARYQENQRQQAAFRQTYAQNSADETRRRNAIYEPRYQEYLAAGFHSFEAKVFGDTHVNGSLTPDKQRTIYTPAFPVASIRAREAYTEFKRKENTASFEELFDLVTEFNLAPYTALLALKKLEKRFPEKKALLEASYLFHTASVWGTYNDGFTSAPYRWADEDIKKQVLDIYKQYFASYPAAAMLVATKANPDFSPLNLILAEMKARKQYKEASELAIMALKAPPSWKKNEKLSRALITSMISYLYYKGSKVRADDMKQIAAAHQIMPRIMMEWMTGKYEGEPYRTAYQFEGYKAPFAVSYFENGFDLAMKEIGESGDADALNTHAIAVAFDRTREKPKTAVELWKKAADAGSAWGLYNLFAAAWWKFKWYSVTDLPAAKEKLSTFKPATEYDKAVLKNMFDLKNESIIFIYR